MLCRYLLGLSVITVSPQTSIPRLSKNQPSTFQTVRSGGLGWLFWTTSFESSDMGLGRVPMLAQLLTHCLGLNLSHTLRDLLNHSSELHFHLSKQLPVVRSHLHSRNFLLLFRQLFPYHVVNFRDLQPISLPENGSTLGPDDGEEVLILQNTGFPNLGGLATYFVRLAFLTLRHFYDPAPELKLFSLRNEGYYSRLDSTLSMVAYIIRPYASQVRLIQMQCICVSVQSGYYLRHLSPSRRLEVERLIKPALRRIDWARYGELGLGPLLSILLLLRRRMGLHRVNHSTKSSSNIPSSHPCCKWSPSITPKLVHTLDHCIHQTVSILSMLMQIRSLLSLSSTDCPVTLSISDEALSNLLKQPQGPERLLACSKQPEVTMPIVTQRFLRPQQSQETDSTKSLRNHSLHRCTKQSSDVIQLCRKLPWWVSIRCLPLFKSFRCVNDAATSSQDDLNFFNDLPKWFYRASIPAPYKVQEFIQFGKIHTYLILLYRSVLNVILTFIYFTVV